MFLINLLSVIIQYFNINPDYLYVNDTKNQDPVRWWPSPLGVDLQARGNTSNLGIDRWGSCNL